MSGPCKTHGLYKKHTLIFTWKTLKERGSLEVLLAGKTIILKWILQKWDMKISMGFIWLMEGIL
jgi:hypothetical protein